MVLEKTKKTLALLGFKPQTTSPQMVAVLAILSQLLV
jgi:hypothetical protein